MELKLSLAVSWASIVAQLVKESACNAQDLGSILGSGRSPEEGNGNPLQCSCLENSMTEEPDGLFTAHGVAKSRTQLSDFHFHMGHLFAH